MRALVVAGMIFMSMAVKATGDLSNAQAMYIYNFLRHIQWPEGSAGDKFVIGVYGDADTFDQLVHYTSNRKVGSRFIEIRKISSTQQASSCQLVFVSNSQSSKIRELNRTLGNSSCLIVGEKEGSNSSGSTIEFVIKDSKLKFRINEEKAKTQNLLISRALIDMAI